VPLHLRNAPTKLMKRSEYGKGYRYAHDEGRGVADMSCLPPSLEGRRFTEPTERGFEKENQAAARRLGRDQEAAPNDRVNSARWLRVRCRASYACRCR
jgi:putative ATPase